VNSGLFKVEGAGNDFLLGLGEWSTRLAQDAELARTLCDRRRGIGADGVLALEPRGENRLEIFYRNADGSPGAFCANATRCAARAAVDLLGRSNRMTIATGWDEIRAEVSETGVTLDLPAPGSLPRSLPISVPDWAGPFRFLTIGVPHLVSEVSGLAELELERVAPGLRGHEAVGADGANVDFYEIEDDGLVRIRTWERGVEAETLSCGSGMVAVALVVMAEKGLDELVLAPASGDRLRIRALGEPPDCATRFTGPARIVARIEPTGELDPEGA
jgi:diaminopimelate epimerase